MNMSSRFHVSSRYAFLPTRPIAIILTHISAAKKAKMRWSQPASRRHRTVEQISSTHGWYIPSVRQLRRITPMLILSNHVTTHRSQGNDKRFQLYSDYIARSLLNKNTLSHIKHSSLNHQRCVRLTHTHHKNMATYLQECAYIGLHITVEVVVSRRCFERLVSVSASYVWFVISLTGISHSAGPKARQMVMAAVHLVKRLQNLSVVTKT